VPIHPDGATLLQPHFWLTHRLATGQSQMHDLTVPRRQLPCVKQVTECHSLCMVMVVIGPRLGCTYLGRTSHMVAGQLFQAAATGSAVMKTAAACMCKLHQETSRQHLKEEKILHLSASV